VEIFHRGKRVASHVRNFTAYHHSTVREHIPKNHQAHLEWTPSRLIHWGESVGEATVQVICTILNSKPHPEMVFARDRQMDLCAWCRAGHGVALLPTFSYIPGEPLGKYLELPKPEPDAPIDVHGSQVELLKKSRCFQSSSMTCLTCHDVHATQRDPLHSPSIACAAIESRAIQG
jgi:hypothetical protein